MRIPRIYQNKILNIHDSLVLDADPSRRLKQVLRLSKDNHIILFNGNGYEYTGVITEIKKLEVRIKILESNQKDCESPVKIHLGQVISKGEKMDFVIQKSTELGVTSIQPLFSERCVVQLKSDRLEKKIEHWHKIAIHAAEQSGRTVVPSIKKPMPLIEWLHSKSIEEKCNRLFLNATAKNCLKDIAIADCFALLIGPEGGLTETEIDYAERNNFKGLRLGKRILRTETAALAALVALQCKIGDF